MNKTFEQKAHGSLLGLFVGDALGASVEFKKRGTYPHHSVYLGGGEFNLAPGQWTDDTSLALCLMESLIQKEQFDLVDQMNHFVKWWKYGELSSTGYCFDIGNTTKKGLERFLQSENPIGGELTDPATNGAIMRLAPIPIFFHSSLNKSIYYSVLQTKSTHGALESIEASALMAYVLYFALQGKSKNEILKFIHFEYPLTTRLIKIKNGEYKYKNETQINAEGFAFNTLEAALYAFFKFDNFIEGLVFVVNLGDDTDTVGAVYGQIAGAYYGKNSIPEYYLKNLYEFELLEKKINTFLEIIND